MVHFHIITLFPESIRPYVRSSIVGRAIKDGKLSVDFYNPRDYTEDAHRRVDRRPYGGGPGMVLEPLSILKAIGAARGRKRKVRILFFSPSGRQFDSVYAKELTEGASEIILIAGHYEGVDARVEEILKAEAVSIGPYVLTGGELPAAVVIDAVARFVPGILGNATSLEERRVASPEVYTRPEILLYKRKKYPVPKVLLSGNHAEMTRWKRERIKKRLKQIMPVHEKSRQTEESRD